MKGGRGRKVSQHLKFDIFSIIARGNLNTFAVCIIFIEKKIRTAPRGAACIFCVGGAAHRSIATIRVICRTKLEFDLCKYFHQPKKCIMKQRFYIHRYHFFKFIVLVLNLSTSFNFYKCIH